jgi:hypothetical protein
MGLYPLDKNDSFTRRDYRLYADWLKDDATSSVQELSTRDAYPGDNVIYALHFHDGCDLPKPDILHTLRLGMPVYLTIRNLPAAIRNKDTTQSLMLVGL